MSWKRFSWSYLCLYHSYLALRLFAAAVVAIAIAILQLLVLLRGAAHLWTIFSIVFWWVIINTATEDTILHCKRWPRDLLLQLLQLWYRDTGSTRLARLPTTFVDSIHCDAAVFCDATISSITIAILWTSIFSVLQISIVLQDILRLW